MPKWLLCFNRWWDRHGGNTDMVYGEMIFLAGWLAAKRDSKMTTRFTILCGAKSETILTAIYSEEFSDHIKLEWPELGLSIRRAPMSRPRCSDDVPSYLPLSETQQRELIDGWMQAKYRKPIVWCTQSDIVFTTIRLAIKNKIISSDEVELRWYDSTKQDFQVLTIDQDGRLPIWPHGFFTLMSDLLCEII